MAPRSDGDFLEKVRACVDIQEIIAGYIPLKKIGGRYRGLCPFHSEKTPSFYVDAGKQLFYCFGCRTGGDAFKFLMLYEKLDFPEALQVLARRYGVPAPEKASGFSSEKQQLLKVNRAALQYFRETLRKRSEGGPGREYLSQRGIAPGTADAFDLGFAPARWDGIKTSLLGAGFKEAQLVAAGILLRKEGTDRTYDRFRNRLIFPICTLSGECVGFGGRILGDGEPKYLNSPETPLFRKGEMLYGVHRTAEAMRKEDRAILVEGYMDLLSLYQAGFQNVAATLGTGFTPAHSRLLSRFTKRVVVNFDPDSAGRAAALRSLDLLLESGFDVHVLRLTGGKDPDRFVREEGAGAYTVLLESAPSCIEYLAREAAEKVDLGSSAGKIEALNLVLPYVARLENAVERSEQVKLLSDLFRIHDGIVLQELKLAIAAKRTNLKFVPLEGTQDAPSGPAARFLRVVIDEPDAREALLPEVRDVDFEGSDVERIWRAVRDLAGSGLEVSYPRIGSLLADPGDQARLLQIASMSGPAASLSEARDCLRRLKLSKLARVRQELQERLERAAPGSPVDDLLRKKMDLRREIRALRSTPAP